jgi:hypothetical protein
MSDISMTELELAMRKLANTVKLDTIEACAKIAEDYDGAGMDSKGYHDHLGDAYKTRQDIADAIRALCHPTAGRVEG